MNKPNGGAVPAAIFLKGWLRVKKSSQQDQLKAMKQRIRELERAIAEARMRELLTEGHFEVLCGQIGVNPNAQRDKLQEQLSSSTAEKPPASQD